MKNALSTSAMILATLAALFVFCDQLMKRYFDRQSWLKHGGRPLK